MADLEVEQLYVPTVLDLPLAAKEAASEADFVFVFLWVKKPGPLDERVLLKLVDIELSTNVRVFKAWGAPSVGKDPEPVLQKLARKWAAFLTDAIVRPERFVPGYEEPSDSDLDDVEAEDDAPSLGGLL